MSNGARIGVVLQLQQYPTFKDIYTSTFPSRIEEVTHLISAKVTVDMNESLIKEFTVEEVQASLLQMHPTKAPEPAGMSAIFYRNIGKLLGLM